jgi:hypothetical protein
MLMSATTSDDVEQLTKLVLHNPTTLNLLAAAGGAGAASGSGGEGGEAGADAAGLAGGGAGAAAEIAHFHHPCAREDRPLVVLALLKLGLLRKKVRGRPRVAGTWGPLGAGPARGFAGAGPAAKAGCRWSRSRGAPAP